ncbi:PorT family protein [Hymenobacter nivis]|uniref:Outer membrane protein beta-barrel domain-containing protein n=1 Tax=Hymenobacter nivis TaxID=1850093 RepID=A0A502GX86_9BACT|nr:PorT family protein [Hymenobacter nivis]TPG67027.1 hypothetical protein EAH73_04605 [Hymenobacter nivis]
MAFTDPASHADHDADRPQGSLEDLFRHHLAQAEAPPRPMLWEQIDTALLVHQNETYRRRLAATRWVAAASLLLATLAGGGAWWAHQGPQGPPVAATAPVPGAPRARGWVATGAPGTSRGGAPAAASHRGAVGSGADKGADMGAGYLAAGQQLAAGAPGSAYANYANAASGRGAGYAAGAPAMGTGRSNAPGLANAGSSRGAAFGAAAEAGAAALASSATGRHGGIFRTAAAAYTEVTAQGPGNDAAAAVATAPLAAEWDVLDQRSAALPKGLATALPVRLAAVAVAPNVAAAPLKRWQFGVSVASGVFSPNADFSQNGGAPAPTVSIPYSMAASTNAVAFNNRSAAEYRQYLRGGLDQRVAVRATRLLGGHWALRTGVELGQHEAQSATSTSFVGEQLPTYYAASNITTSFAPGPALRTTSFRYRTVGVPVAVHYANPAKRGWSGYGHLGAVVGALLSVRSEVAGEPGATKDYPLAAPGSPYRRLLTTLRGGAGVQYRAGAGRWALSAGPTAEIGVLSLNAQPVQDFANQRRPYSVGLEAAVDFGGTVKMP